MEKGNDFLQQIFLATSLATCMVTVMGIKARSMGFDLDGIKVEVEKKMKPEPRRVSGINLTFHIPENLALIDDRTKNIMRNTGFDCPVQISLHPEIDVTINWGAWNPS